MKNIKVSFRGKKFNIKAKELSALGKLIGLMFKSKECDSLLFDFGGEGKWSIHSFFVFFPFLAVWLDKKNNVLDYRVVKPFAFSVQPKNKFAKLIELPVNKKNEKLIGRFLSTEKGKV